MAAWSASHMPGSKAAPYSGGLPAAAMNRVLKAGTETRPAYI
jgi:hypothetical protein